MIDVCELTRGEVEVVERCNVLLELGDTARANKYRRHSGVAQGPGDSHLSEGLTAQQGDVVEGPDACEVVVAEHVASERAVSRGSGSFGDAVEVPVGQQALRQDRKGDAPDALRADEVKEAIFDPAVEHGVRRLVDKQWCPEPAEDGDGLAGALVGVRRYPDVEGFATRDGGVKGTEGLLEGGLGVEMVMVEDVDVVESEAPQA